MRIRILAAALCALGAALALALGGRPLSAQQQPCDFLTGGGYIFPTGPATGAKATLATGGGCKNGSGLGTPPAPYWGHLEYQDKAASLKVHGTSITGYMVDTVFFPDPNARLICGTATTASGNVTFIVRAKDMGEPGSSDEFDIQLQGAVAYSTFTTGAPHQLGGGTGGGGNILLHKPNNSNTGVFGGSCPGLPAPSPETITITVGSTGGATGTVTSSPSGISCSFTGSTSSQTGTCSASFAANTTVTLTGVGDAGARPSFSANCTPVAFSSPPQCTVDSTQTVAVTFIPPE
jgi:hypothetical protein